MKPIILAICSTLLAGCFHTTRYKEPTKPEPRPTTARFHTTWNVDGKTYQSNTDMELPDNKGILIDDELVLVKKKKKRKEIPLEPLIVEKEIVVEKKVPVYVEKKVPVYFPPKFTDED